MLPLLFDKIAQYIPQREPFIMLDKIIYWSEDTLVSELKVRENNIFIAKNKISESGLLENIAQTAAAKVGYECSLENVPVPLGYIASFNKVNVFDQASVGDEIITTINVLKDVLNITIVNGKCQIGERKILECEMRILIDKESSVL